MGGLTDLVNNAGIGMAKPLLDYTDKEWHAAHRREPHRHVQRHPGRRRRSWSRPAVGIIVNNASLTGMRPTAGEGPYSAAKARRAQRSPRRPPWSWRRRSG